MYQFTHLAQPIKIGKHIYRNRIIAAPLGRGRFAPDGDAVPRTRWLAELRAKGGCAEVCIGETSIDFLHANRENEPETDYAAMENAPSFKAFSKYAKAIKDNGAYALIELSHAGNARAHLEKGFPIGPVGFTRADGVEVVGMDEKMMEEVCESFATAAEFMKKAGFDGVLIHAGHGWLLNQFLSLRDNHREDEYGGTLENRAKFPIMVIKTVRERCGEEFIIEVRVSGSEMAEGGMEPDEVGQFCAMLDGIADFIHVSVGLYHDPIHSMEFSTMFHPKGCNAKAASIIKSYTTLPVAVVGGINDPAFADSLIADGMCDMVALARALSADPEWANKALNGNEDDIAKCLRCHCCFPGPKEDVLEENHNTVPKLQCTINPLNDLGIPLESFSEPNGSRKVLVIGGGVAGMQAAVIANDRGHKVTLVESSDKLGGLLNFTDSDYYKTDLHEFKELMKRRVLKRDIEVLLNTAADADYIKSFNPEAVVIAVGSEPTVPDVPGIEYAHKALDIYFDDISKIGQKVVIVGGGLVGCESGLNLAKMGKDVTIVGRNAKLAKDAYKMHWIGLMDEMKKSLKTITGVRCTEITPTGVHTLDAQDNKGFIPADTVIYALGMKAKSDLVNELLTVCGNAQTFVIGDCDKASKVVKAMEDGWLAGMRIV